MIAKTPAKVQKMANVYGRLANIPEKVEEEEGKNFGLRMVDHL